MRHRERGFVEISRKDPGYRPVEERVRDYKEVEQRLSPQELNDQAARCMDCGIPFCQSAHSSVGCPVFNRIPEFNDQVYHGQWESALELLLEGSSFPEFTGRICPAPCEASCVCDINRDPVAIRQIELTIIEHAFTHGLMRARLPVKRLAGRVAVVGSGPAGLAAAHRLNQAGVEVVVYEKDVFAGGMLRYGIPDFKLEKTIVERRIALMKEEGVAFECGVEVGRDLSFRYLQQRFDAVLLAGGARQARDLPVEGRGLKGILFAMDFLTRQNAINSGERSDNDDVFSARGKHVVVIGGGDTGSDCVGTSIRQGAKSVTQFEILPRPPDDRPAVNPWPQWPNRMRTSSSHQEGCTRRWAVETQLFQGKEGAVQSLNAHEVRWVFPEGEPRPVPEKVEGSDFNIPAELVLLAMGFVSPGQDSLLSEMGVACAGNGFVQKNSNNRTSAENVFVAGDMADGPSLVVRAMQDGKNAADAILQSL